LIHPPEQKSMKKCKAFYPIARSRTAWIPCVRRAESQTGFCRRHGDAIFGVMLGAIVYEKAVDEDADEAMSGQIKKKR
jgi:hypothetical protein